MNVCVIGGGNIGTALSACNKVSLLDIFNNPSADMPLYKGSHLIVEGVAT